MSNGLLKLLNTLLSDELVVEEKRIILEEEFGIKMTVALESEVSLMCNLSKGIEEKGIKKGREEGEVRMITLIEKLLKDNRYDDISKITLDTKYRHKLFIDYKIN